jgi:uncharacterized membrane protein
MSLTPTEFRTRSVDHKTIWILGLLMVGVILFSVLFLSGQSLRLDEAQSLWQSSHSPAGVLKVVASDVHVPLHHLLLHMWQKWFGNDVSLARDFSLVFFVLTIPAVYLLGNLSFSRSVALFATIMVAVSPFLNWYGSEIRMYSLLTLLTVLNQYFFVLIFKKRPIRPATWLGYALTAILGTFTHYFFSLILMVQVLFFLTHRRLFSPDAFKKLILIALVLLAFLGPWLNYVVSLRALGNSQPNLSPPTTINLFNSFSQFVFGFQDDHVNTLIVSLWPLSVLLAFLALRKRSTIAPDARYFLLAAIVPVVVAFCVSVLLMPLFVTRYLIVTVPSLYLFLGWVISTYPRPLRNPIKAIIISVMCLMLIQQAWSASTPVKENFREATAYLNVNAGPRDVIAVSAPFTIYPVVYYYKGSAQVTTLPIWNRFDVGSIPPFDPKTLPAQVDALKGDHQNLWLLLSYDQGYQEELRLYFDGHYKRIAEFDFSPGLTLYQYKLRYP